MILGDNLGLEEATNIALNALVGRFSYRSRCITPLYSWVKTHWLPIFGYVPMVFYLPWGWFGFNFHSPEDAAKILEGPWPHDGGSIMLKCWRLSFDPAQDYFQFRHLWVLLPGLPLNFWTLKVLMVIGNSIGHFIGVYEQALGALDRKLGQVLVEVDIHSGLLETLDIQWRDRCFHRGWITWVYHFVAHCVERLDT